MLPAAVTAYFTTRLGGRSSGPYATLNLATHVGDEPSDVAANRAALVEAMGAPMVYLDQVHSADVVTVSRTDAGAAPHRADALVTAEAGVALAIMTADCAPLLLADTDAGVIGAAHAGRAGLLAGVAGATVVAMVSLGADARAIQAVIGPTICGRCYEVPAELAHEAARLVPAAATTTRRGTPGIDIPAGLYAQLTGLGLASVRTLGVCTFESHECFSYRREGVTGRMAGCIARVPERSHGAGLRASSRAAGRESRVNSVTHEADRATRRTAWQAPRPGSTTVMVGSFPTPQVEE